MERLVSLSLVIWPSTGPLLYSRVRAACRAENSFCRPQAKFSTSLTSLLEQRSSVSLFHHQEQLLRYVIGSIDFGPSQFWKGCDLYIIVHGLTADVQCPGDANNADTLLEKFDDLLIARQARSEAARGADCAEPCYCDGAD